MSNGKAHSKRKVIGSQQANCLDILSFCGLCTGLAGGFVTACLAIDESRISNTQLNQLAKKVARQIGYRSSIIQGHAAFIVNGRRTGAISVSAFDALYHDCTGQFFLENGCDVTFSMGPYEDMKKHISAYERIRCNGNTIWSRYYSPYHTSEYLVPGQSDTAIQFNKQFQSCVQKVHAKLMSEAQPMWYVAAGFGALTILSIFATMIIYYRQRPATKDKGGICSSYIPLANEGAKIGAII